MEWVASSTLHTTSEHGVSSITTAVVHTYAASSRLGWGPRAGLDRCGKSSPHRDFFCVNHYFIVRSVYATWFIQSILQSMVHTVHYTVHDSYSPFYSLWFIQTVVHTVRFTVHGSYSPFYSPWFKSPFYSPWFISPFYSPWFIRPFYSP